MKISKSNSLSGDKYFNTDQLRSDLRKRAVKGAGAAVFARVSVYGIQMIGTIILARLLTPDTFGLIAMIAAFGLLLQNFGLRGFTEATIQSEEISHEKISTLFWIHLGLSVTLTLLFMASAPLIARFYGEPRLQSISIVFSFSFIFSALSTHHLALLSRNMLFHKVAANQISATIVSSGIAVILAWQGWGYWALLAKWVTLPMASAVGAWILCHWRPGRPSRGTGVKQMLKFGMHTYGNFSMNYLSRNIDKILIGWRYNTQLLGNYEKAYYLFVMPVNQLSYPLTNVAVSALSRLRDAPDKFRSYYLKALSMLAFIGMPLSAILTLIGKDFILLLLGPQWGKAGEIFTVFGPCIGILLIYGTHGWLHLSLGRADRWFRWGIIEVAATISSFVIGLPFGAIGVAVAYGISFHILIGPGLWYAGKPIDIKLSSILSVLWKFYVSALASGLFCWFILYLHGSISNIFFGLNIFVRILVSFFLFTSVYLLLVVTFSQGIKPLSEFISLLQEMLSKNKKKTV